MDGNTSCQVYVGNLGWDVTTDDLTTYMASVGSIISAHVVMGKNGRSRGYGVVVYDSESAALRAMTELTDTDIKGRKIFVREDRETKPAKTIPPAPAVKEQRLIDHSKPDPRATEKTVLVSNIPSGSTWQELKDFMRSAGAIVRVDITNSEKDGTGIGSVELKTEDGVANALALNGATFRSSIITVRRSNTEKKVAPSEISTSGRRVYVGQLGWSVSWKDLKDHFKPIGTVTRADVVLENDTHRSRGFGFVEFQDVTDAEKAIRELNDSLLHGRRIHVRADRVRK